MTGDACPRCGATVDLVRSVEAAHTFQLGHKYSDVMPGASFVAEDGGEAVFSMGCYGMGVSRLLAVVAEEHHDERGLVWPADAGPLPGPPGSRWAPGGRPRWPRPPTPSTTGWWRPASRSSTTTGTCRPGVKFADADLLGVPVRLVVGGKGVARGIVEWRSRATGEERERAAGRPRPRCRRLARLTGCRARSRRARRPRRVRARRTAGQGPTRPSCAAILSSLPFGWGVVTLMKRGRSAHAFVLVRKRLSRACSRSAGRSGPRWSPARTRTRTRRRRTTGEEAAQMVEDLFAALQPVVAAVGLELVDVEMKSGVLQVTVDREGGVDLEALTDANRAVSALLDELDPIPGRYSLEVSSPGIERPLRTPAHFAKAVGATVTVKTRPQVPGERRLRGTLLAADDEGFTLAVEGSDDEPVRLAYADVDRARTVFVWGGQDTPGSPPAGSRAARPVASPRDSKQTQKRKQVVTP